MQLYKLNQCYELSKLNENTPIDQVLETYGQLQHDGEIKKFSRYDLHIINQLWVKYSDGKFGFSIQKQIFQDHKQFTARCGWIENLAKNEWIKYEDYNFTLDANRGHLPSTPRIVGLGFKNVNEIPHRLNIFYSKY